MLLNPYRFASVTAAQYLSPTDKSTNISLSNANRTATRSSSASAWRSVRSVASHSSGKWYFEWTANSNNNGGMIGLTTSNLNVNSQYPGQTTDSWGYYYNSSGGEVYHNASASLSGSGTVSAGSYARVAVDIDAGKIWFGNASAWKASGNPGAGTGEVFLIPPNTDLYIGVGLFSNGNVGTLNSAAGQMSGVVPAGFLPWDS